MQSNWPERIVVGIDTSPESETALDRALELATRGASSVVVVHAVGLLEEGSYRRRPDVPAIVSSACRRTGCSPRLVGDPVIEDGPAIDVLLRAARRLGGDLIVVGRRGTGIAEGSLGSTSRAIVDRADVPVLVVTHE